MEFKMNYTLDERSITIIRKTVEAKESVSALMSAEEKRLKELDLWSIKDSQPYKQLEEAYWSIIDAINAEIHFAAEGLRDDVLDELVNKLT